MDFIGDFALSWEALVLLLLPALIALFSGRAEGARKYAWVALLFLTSWIGFIFYELCTEPDQPHGSEPSRALRHQDNA